MKQTRARLLATVTVVVTVVGLGLSPSDGAGAAPSQKAAVQYDDKRPLDEGFELIGEAVPGFAGAYVQDGHLMVVLTPEGDPDELEDIRQMVATVTGDPALLDLPVEAAPATYTFAELRRWRLVVGPVAFSLGAVSLDIDEVSNQIVVGVPSGVDQVAVTQAALATGLPPAALEVIHQEPVMPGLRNVRRPMVGGLQIEWLDNSSDFWICTLGYVADRNGVRGFVTNSHCSDTVGGLDSTPYAQPTLVGPEDGEEYRDPGAFIGGACIYSGWRCRWADANFVRFTAFTATSERGSIAHPGVNCFPLPCAFPFEWNGTAKFFITGENNATVGQAVSKVGRTTGFTTGSVSQTCTDVSLSGTNIVFLCQSKASFINNHGDSGSAVFSGNASGGTNRSLRGIYWGIGGWFSPASNIQADLGTLINCVTTAC